ncbi:Uncharacterized protein dnm_054450 [Desulfonema magnum]|uniref:Uncharacterized protein n=1 Tax=Desulfonema magnum TaxID=45655 RepID=A0A975BQL3_9BACT|nr:Uncharacterized protein dnm_054450 [Desulfonema magnum]
MTGFLFDPDQKLDYREIRNFFFDLLKLFDHQICSPLNHAVRQTSIFFKEVLKSVSHYVIQSEIRAKMDDKPDNEPISFSF